MWQVSQQDLSPLKYDAGLGRDSKKYGLFWFKAVVYLKCDTVKKELSASKLGNAQLSRYPTWNAKQKCFTPFYITAIALANGEGIPVD